MLTVISCRESSTSANQFGAHVIPGLKRFFDGGPSAQPILIHGYNRTEDQVTRDYISFSSALGRDCIAYSWPGGSHPLDFPPAVSRARLAGYRLQDVLSMRHSRACLDSLVTHSLGARVALTALSNGLLTVKNLILMAPAVDWNVFENGGEFKNVPECCEFVHVLYSNKDEVLKLAFPLGDFGGDCHALGLDGPRDPLSVAPNIMLHDLSGFISDHSAYVTDPQCAALVKRLLD